jgi:hypothetical protein
VYCIFTWSKKPNTKKGLGKKRFGVLFTKIMWFFLITFIKKRGSNMFSSLYYCCSFHVVSLIMWLMLQVNQYFETSVPNNWVVETNEPSHWQVTWPKDGRWDWVLCSHALEYFFSQEFCNTYVGGVTPNIRVFMWVFRTQNVITCKARLLGFELELMKGQICKFVYHFSIVPNLITCCGKTNYIVIWSLLVECLSIFNGYYLHQTNQVLKPMR